MTLMVALFSSILFVVTNGFYQRERFENNRFLAFIVGTLAIISFVSTVLFVLERLNPDLLRKAVTSDTNETVATPSSPVVVEEPPRDATKPTLSPTAPSLKSAEKASELPGDTEVAPSPIARTESPEGPRNWRLIDSASYEQISMQDATSASFPFAYLKDSIGRELGDYTYQAGRVRIGATFIEPQQFRAQAGHGAIIGYLVLSLPQAGDCTRQFGGVGRFDFGTPELGIKKAIDRQTGEIAAWLRRATANGRVECPGG